LHKPYTSGFKEQPVQQHVHRACCDETHESRASALQSEE